MAKREKITDDELRVIVDREVRNSFGYRTGKLSEARRKALQYFLARPVGDLAPPDIEGRSSVVSTDVADTIRGMLPGLIKVFHGGDSVVEFEPTTASPDDAQNAEQATAYINFIYNQQNPGYAISRTWMMDAMLSKVGIVKAWWEEKEESGRETYQGLNDIELARIDEDEEVEIIEHDLVADENDGKQREMAIAQLSSQMQQAAQAAQMGDPNAVQAIQQMQEQIAHIQSQPPIMLHDVVCIRTKKRAGVRVENVPPEEFLISRAAKSIHDTPFVAHQVRRSIGELRAMGFKDVDNLSSDDESAAMSAERVERLSNDDEFGGYTAAYDSAPTSDSMRMVWLTEAYVKCDRNGTGILGWVKVLKAGNEMLDVEEVDCPPFAIICPDPLPHRFFGASVADMAMEVQKTKTAILRSGLDNLAIQTNGRFFAVEGQCNLDDLLTSRPGGVVRIKTPGAVGRLEQGMGDLGSAMQMLEYVDRIKEERTGWGNSSSGVDSDALNTSTATGINIVTNKADDRQEMVARNFAEGYKELFGLILKLVCQHQDKEAQIAVAGQWITVDPRQWRNKFDLTCHVGLGSGNKDQQVQHLMAFGQYMQQAATVGLVGPEQVKAYGDELAKALGLRNAKKFLMEKPIQQQGPQDPAIAVEHMRQQGKQAEMQATMQLEREKTQLEMQQAQFAAQAEAQKKDAELRLQTELELVKAQHAQELEQMKIQAQQDIEWRKAQLDAETKIIVASIGAQKETESTADDVSEGIEEPNTNAVLAQAMMGFQAALERLNQPRQIVRGPDGRVAGVM